MSPLLPSGVDDRGYIEPFLGGGAVFFALQPRNAVLCDVNPDLITAYAAVRDDVERLIAHLEGLSRGHDAEHYYRMRKRYNDSDAGSPTERAALFIYLNKTCFNGLHRVNRRGEFNVPLGRYAKPNIVNAPLLRAASEQLQFADLRCEGFEAVVATARPGDFVYFDPPYAPVSATANFTSYAQDGFGPADQSTLRDVFVELDRRGCKLMLSNSDVAEIRELYAGFQIDSVAAPRAINCDASKRGAVGELVIRNYW